MRILMINVVCGIRSTGRICTDLAAALEAQGHEVKIAYGREDVPEQYKKYAVRIGNDLDVNLHVVEARLFDACGFGSTRATREFINWVKEYDPDVIHLHNIHGYYINIDILFDYLKSCGKKIIWTLHDCWAFTGHAAYCEGANCERWIDGCYNCPKNRDYPVSYFDRSHNNWMRKKELFSSIPNLTLVTPSYWLKRLVEKSFLKEYPVVVIHNGIDTDKFRCLDNASMDNLDIAGKKVILGVAAKWDERKGLNDFIKLDGIIDHNNYQIVVVGLTENQIRQLPQGMTGITETDTVDDLVNLYNTATVFVNFTYEDNYPTTNLEAIACGTPVISYDTGGSGESAVKYGRVIEKAGVEEALKIIENDSYNTEIAPDVSIGTMLRQYIYLIDNK